MPVTLTIGEFKARLPRLPEHRDPFDRLLVWIAIREDFTLVSRDGAMRAYGPHGLKVCW